MQNRERPEARHSIPFSGETKESKDRSSEKLSVGLNPHFCLED